MTITVHHLNNSRSQRVLWALEELGLDYQIERYQRDAKTMLAPPELRKIHPLGKSPVIDDGKHVLAESGAILQYLVDEYGNGRLKPTAPADLLRCNYWMHYAEGSAMPPLLLSLVFSTIKKAPVPFFVKPIVNGIVSKVRSGFIDPQLEIHLNYMEGELSKSLWFAGDEFTVADIQMSFPIEAANSRAPFGDSKPKLTAYLERIHARPAYQKALDRGGPYSIL